MNAIQNIQIETIKERVFQCIKEHNGAYDLVDISCEFKEYTVDIQVWQHLSSWMKGELREESCMGIDVLIL